MTGFRIKLTNVRPKTDPVTGRTQLEKFHKLPVGQRKNQAAKAARRARQWKAKGKSRT